MGVDASVSTAQRTKHDIAYGCFLPPGLVSLLTALASALPMDDANVAGIGFLVLIPLALVALISVPTGIYFSFMLRRDAVLAILSVLTIFMVAEVVAEAGSATFYNATIVAYGIIVTVTEASWFLLRRRRTYPT